ncbi:gamma carbonic anhydrase family protein [Gloeobacter morelensis]|uniref:Gamma carbonic anhydrase family protein n=1 Tax=Gloeobacter morelensis MG652769 TaxID=2781736 RepID=A0ABY3PSA1_9CYAN|nr:gamma carbonic anhydrase family protein [Gloeobacter morelensis]UFP96593.1 gamma carbonic anhydrase family protein [Gloeobacter morelensis MG652769]
MDLESIDIALGTPDLSLAAFVAPDAVVVGRVAVARGVSLWYGAVLRGDVERIEIGEDTNIQDGAVLHGDPGRPVIVGARVTVGHRAVIHAAVVEDECLIGIGAVVLDGVTVGTQSIVAAGAVVTRTVPPGSLVAGVPARVVRTLEEAEKAERRKHALNYRALAEHYRNHHT